MENQIVVKLNESITFALEANKMQGFEKAYKLADATQQLKNLLTPEYLKPIMELQGNKLGFKTDKDGQSGYQPDTVKNCIIEAVLTGVQVVGNQFNIIAGNCYITKEGFGHLLKNVPGLTYEIIPQLPRVNQEQTSAAIKMQINWSFNKGQQETREIEFPIRMNKFMGIDAVIGKATRKARAWLYNNISGLEIADGDIQDVPSTVVDSKLNEKVESSPKPERKKKYKNTVEVEQDFLKGAITREEADDKIREMNAAQEDGRATTTN
jgi:hypothetical protein